MADDTDLTLRVGKLLKDGLEERKGRVVELLFRINPMGDVPPYWRVKNVDTGRETTIREDRIKASRWSETDASEL